ncbi:MAG: hypothetical protein IMY84_06090, partial [Chloroflexi bacterium]|nr:hypothetical protein [Chloroflexota bacterium]
RPPEQIVQDLFDEGVDYAVIGSWANSWGEPYREAVVELVNQVRLNGTLVKVIEPDVDCRVEVYQLGRQQDSISNGDLEYWEAREGMVVPVDWNPVLISGDGDRAFLQPARIDRETWVGFHVYEDGIADVGAGATHAGMRQRIAFPRHEILLEVMPGINTESLGETPLGPAVHFLDRQSGHSVVLGFSDELEEEKVTTADTGSSVVVRRPAPLHQWSEHRFDLTEYWRETGWPLPDELTVLVVLSAHSDYPGYYTFHVARVETVQP